MILQKSSIDDFLAVIRGVFAKDPPLMSNQELQRVSQPQVPPPVPPPPSKYKLTPQEMPEPNLRSPGGGHQMPPELPPKPGVSISSTASPPDPTSRRGDGPPLPPLPPIFREGLNHSANPRGVMQGSPVFLQPGQSYPIGSVGRADLTGTYPHHHELETPASPIRQDPFPQQYMPFTAPHMPQGVQYQTQPTPQHPSYAQVPPFPHNIGHPPQQPPQQYVKKPPTAPQIDLLGLSLEVTLPSQTGTLSPLPAPPIPPNPEKDALLQAISQALIAETQRTMESNKTAVSHLLAQQSALRAAHGVLQAELDTIQSLDATLDNNERVLRSAMQEAEKVMKDTAGRPRPDIDDVLVCPTVVGSQLYSLVADEKACEEARVALVRGLDKGRITLDVFVKQTRSLAREEFLKKALIRKIAVGMGLEERPW
jgi:ESCRT-I complex subunit TSG101